MFIRGSTGFISCVGSIVGSAFGASSSSIGGNSFTGASASIVLVISGSTSDIYNILYILSKICHFLSIYLLFRLIIEFYNTMLSIYSIVSTVCCSFDFFKSLNSFLLSNIFSLFNKYTSLLLAFAFSLSACL